MTTPNTPASDGPSDGAMRAVHMLHVALMDNDGESLDEEYAASIIDRETAAPELKAACHAIEDYFEAHNLDNDDNPLYVQLKAALDKAALGERVY